MLSKTTLLETFCDNNSNYTTRHSHFLAARSTSRYVIGNQVVLHVRLEKVYFAYSIPVCSNANPDLLLHSVHRSPAMYITQRETAI